MVGFAVDFYWYQIGAGEFLYSFFSTVCVNLEDGKWGSRYPYIMKGLYQGKLEPARVPQAIKELNKIKKELAKLPPTKVVWSMEDLSKQPPWGDKISSHITSLANYYVNSDGDDFLTLFLHALEMAEKIKEPIKIDTL